MRTADLNAELLREISAIISDKELTRKTLEFVRSLRGDYLHTDAVEEETISKKEIKRKLKAGLKDVKEGRVRPAEELLYEL